MNQEKDNQSKLNPSWKEIASTTTQEEGYDDSHSNPNPTNPNPSPKHTTTSASIQYSDDEKYDTDVSNINMDIYDMNMDSYLKDGHMKMKSYKKISGHEEKGNIPKEQKNHDGLDSNDIEETSSTISTTSSSGAFQGDIHRSSSDLLEVSTNAFTSTTPQYQDSSKEEDKVVTYTNIHLRKDPRHRSQEPYHDLSSDDLTWPWNHHSNKTKSPTPAPIPKNDTSCASITSCNTCTSSLKCHWCAHDQQCHAKASVYGCAIGASCDAPPPTPPKNDTSCASMSSCADCTSSLECHWCSYDQQCHAKGSFYGCTIGASCDAPPPIPKENKTCHHHTTCTQCALASRWCHWCPDEKCHAIGSWYGCSHGLNCYSNQRCRRLEPEYVPSGLWDGVGVIPLVLIFGMGAFVICCSSILVLGVGTIRGAYQDLAYTASDGAPSDVVYQLLEEDGDEEDEGLDTAIEILPHEDGCDDVADHDDHVANTDEDAPNVADEVAKESKNISEDIGDDEEEAQPNTSSEDNDEDDVHSSDETTPRQNMLANSTTSFSSWFNNNNNNNNNQTSSAGSNVNTTRSTVTAIPDPSRVPTTTSRNLRCFHSLCKAWYTLTLLTTVTLSFLAIYYFPKAPTYNVCSDEFAWKSIIDGLTSFKMKASFELLMSIQNTNRIDVSMEDVSGHFYHDGHEVGTFTMPSDTTIYSSSITDVLITCTVVPDRGQALSLISDYYKGRLVFTIDASGSAKVQGIGFAFPIDIENVMVKVNDPDNKDRSLCACPEWKQVTSDVPTPTLAAPDFMQIDMTMDETISISE